MSEIQNIPLAKLKASKERNVRRTGGKKVEELAASIRASGLLQNLGVVANGNGFEVVFGGRRLRALKQLQKAGELPESLAAGIPCQVVSGEDAREASLAENTIREAMSPLDQFQAFQELVDEGKDIAEVAARFGVTELFVRQRLRLARVSPKLLKIYGDGGMTLEQLQAFAVADHPERQEALWKRVGGNEWSSTPDRIRAAMAVNEATDKDQRVEFVGLAAYEAAGGQLRRDLFSEVVFLEDIPLLERLVSERLEACAEVLRADGWSWVEINDERPEYGAPRIKGEWQESTDEELAELEDLENRMDGGELLSPADIVRWVTLEGELFTAEQRAASGIRIGLGHNGLISAWSGLLREGDTPPPAPVEDAEEGDDDRQTVQVGTHERVVKKPGDMSFKAVQALQAEANVIIQGSVAQSPFIALALLVAQLAADSRALYGHSYGTKGAGWVRISRDVSGRAPTAVMDPATDGPLGEPMRQLAEKWRKELPKDPTDLVAWAINQKRQVLDDLQAFLVASEIDAVDLNPGYDRGLTNLAYINGMDLLDGRWRPNEEWLATLTKPVILALVKDAAGERAAEPLAKLKKGELPARALPLLPAGWLPPPLRAQAAPEPNPKPRRAQGKAAAAGEDA